MKINVRKLTERVAHIFRGSKSSRLRQVNETKTPQKTAKKSAPKKVAKKVEKKVEAIELKKPKELPLITKKDGMSMEKKVKIKNAILHSTLLNQFLTTVAGDSATRVVGELVEPMQDDDLARRCKVKVTVVRSILNKLHAAGITQYSREKDMRTGWFSYVWRVRFGNMIDVLKRGKSDEITSINGQLGEESGYVFYTCKKGCLKLPFDDAMQNMFRCPSCSGLLYSANNKRKLKSLETKQIKLMGELSKLEEITSKLEE